MLTPGQQRPYRRLVEAAWKSHCRSTLLIAADKAAAREAWYREELMKAVGLRTTKQAHPRHHYLKLMVHFEKIAGEQTYWQERAESEGGRNAMRDLRAFCRQHDVEDDYVDGVAQRMFKRNVFVLKPDELTKVLMALRIHFKPTTAARKALIS